MGTAANVLVGATGKVFGAPAGSTAPTNGEDALDDAYVDMGYISVDGVVEAHNPETKDLDVWGGKTVRTLLTKTKDTFKCTFMETKEEVLEAYHGPQDDPSTLIESKAQQGLRQMWVIEAVDGDNVIRISIEDGQVTKPDDITYATDEAISYGVELTCYPDEDDVTFQKFPPAIVS